MEMRSTLIIVAALIAGLVGGFLATRSMPLGAEAREFQLVTGEWKWESSDGTQELEAYRWDPSVIVVRRDTPVTLKIYGVNGSRHTLSIEQFGVRVVVNRGETSTVRFVANQSGTFEILCLDHPTPEQNGPMIGYLVVI